MPALYRDHRPEKYSEVVNQDHIKTTLRNAVAAGTFSHAYLFTGMRGTGKTTVARILARAINCLNPDSGEPCNKCEVCKQFLNGTSLDLNEIDAASNTGVENIREIIENLKFTPAQAKYKVFIVDEVHMLSKGAFNALLKTLEEPPAHAVFILATTEIHKVPATVVSRTQRFDFKKIENGLMLGHLKKVSEAEKIHIDTASLELIVNAAEGSARDALSILDRLSAYGDVTVEVARQLLGTTDVEASQKFLGLLAARDASGALEFLEAQFGAGVDPVQFNKDFLEYCRKLLLTMNGAHVDFALSESQRQTMHQQSERLSVNHLLHIVRLFLRAAKDFQSSPSADLPVEVSAAEACLQPAGQPAVQSAVPVPPKNDHHSKPEPPAPKPEQTMEPENKPDAQPEKKSDNSPEHTHSRSITNTTTYSQFMAAWPSILDKVKERASTLLTILRTVTVRSLENGEVTIVCGYEFHRESLAIAKNRNVLNVAVEESFGPGLSLNFITEKAEQQQLVDASAAAAEIFG